MSLEETIKELEAAVAPLFDETEWASLTDADLTDIDANLTFFINSINKISKEEFDGTSPERKRAIVRAQEGVGAKTKRAFELLKKVREMDRPPVATGTIPREPQGAGVDIPPTPRPSRADLTLPLILERRALEMQPEPICAPVAPQPQKCGDLDHDVLQNIIEQLRNEFQRMYDNRPIVVPSPTSHEGGEDIDIEIPDDDEQVGVKRNTVCPKTVDKPATPVVKPMMDIKLERVPLPTFGGALTEWISFRDQYLDLVHENPNLTEVMKFYQLRACLNGKPLDVINGFQISTNSYQAAWEAVRQRYDHTGQLINEYIKKVLYLPCLDKNPNREKLLNMVDRTNQMLRVLPHFGIQVQHWDPILMVILLEKLDPTLERKWLDQIKKRDDIKVSEFFEFLEQQAAEMTIMSQSKPVRQNVGQNKGSPKKPVLMMTGGTCKSGGRKGQKGGKRDSNKPDSMSAS